MRFCSCRCRLSAHTVLFAAYYFETECFVQDNFYYLCDAEKEIAAQKLDGYEREEAYTLEVVPPEIAIEKNRSVGKTPYAQEMFEREARVLECVMAEGLFD